MKIDLGDGYFLRSDALNWIVSKGLNIDKRGRENYNSNWFFGELSYAIEFLIERKLRESDLSELSELVAKYEQIGEQMADRLNIGLIPTLIDMRKQSLFAQQREIFKNQ